MAKTLALRELDPKSAAEEWLAGFSAALEGGDTAKATGMLAMDAMWRDLLAFTWHIRTMNGLDQIQAVLEDRLAKTRPTTFHIPSERTPPRLLARAGTECIEAIIAFETALGSANGIIRLVPNPEHDGLQGWILMTALDEIRGHEEAVGNKRPLGENYSRTFGEDNWLDLRNEARGYAEHEPTVLVVGAGQSGLTIAARLGVLGVDTLVVDRHQRIGDNWRKRYHSLTLHNEVYVNHLPYMPFPPNWPVFIPKDKIANWFEAYAESMELNVWMDTALESGRYDEASSTWEIRLRRCDGSERVVRPRHLVFATGVSAIPVIPNLPGLMDFKGVVMHSGSYLNGHSWKGKKALVLGTGNSGHDVAQDLQSCGAEVSIIQRSSTYIVSLHQAQKVYAHYFEGPPIEDNDLLATSFPYPVLLKAYQMSTKEMRRADKDLLDGLEHKGFKLNFGGHDDSGFQMSYLRRGGGYCFNVGCSDLIIEGKVGLLHFDDIERLDAKGARMKDGRLVDADLLVTATGYKNQQETVRHFLGDEIANRVGPVWGFGEGAELRNMWCRTPQPGLWFTAGGLAQIRIYSKYLALQIKAIEEGMLDREIPIPEPVTIADAAD